MRFHKTFTRTVGGGGTALGSDSPPTGSPRDSIDNQMQSSFVIVHDWPVHRVAVGYVGPSGAPSLQGVLYLYDEAAGQWFAMGPPLLMQSGHITYFDVLAIQPPPVRSDSSSGSSGSLEVALVVASASGVPNGDYVFSMAPDLSAYAKANGKLIPEQWDHVDLSYTGNNLTGAVFRQGGSTGPVVATLALTYGMGNLQTVRRT